MSIKALVTVNAGDAVSTALGDIAPADLGAGDVTVAVEWSTVNYKDGLALAGNRIMQSYPMGGGIDFAGTVETSDNPACRPGDKVICNGWDLSQTHNGGYAQKARVPGEWLIPLPQAFLTRDAMAIGTAGYPAMLCVLALEHGGLTPEKGDVLVTGASGGVGSIAISLLSAGIPYHRVDGTRFRRGVSTEILPRGSLAVRTRRDFGSIARANLRDCAREAPGPREKWKVVVSAEMPETAFACGRRLSGCVADAVVALD